MSMGGESIKQQTLTSIKWTSIERFGVQGMQFVLSLIMARLLSPSDYGTVGMIAVFLSISQSFIDSGFGNALTRKLDRTETDYSTVFYFNVVISIACYFLLFILAPYIADFFNTPILSSLLRVQSIILLMNALMLIQVTKLTIELNFKALSKRSLIATVVSGPCGVIMAYCGCGVWSLVGQSIISTLVNLIMIWFYCKWRPLWIFSWKSFKELGSYGSKILAAGLLNSIYTHLTTLVIGKFFTSKDLGYYNRGTHFATFPLNTMNSILQRVTYPIMSRLQNNDDRLISVYRKYICFTSIPIFFCCVLLASISKPMILLLLTEKWLPAAPYLTVFSFAIMFDHICSINLNVLQVKGRSDLFLKLEVIKKTISIAILFASIPFGVMGICVSVVIYTQIAVYINTYYTGKLFNLGYLTQMKDFIKYFIASVVACIPAFCLSYFIKWHPVLSLIVSIITSISLYCLFLRKDIYFKEMVSMVRGKLSIIHK